MPRFDDIEIGQVVHLGSLPVSQKAALGFIESFAPAWPLERGAPDAMVFAIWDHLADRAAAGPPPAKRVGVDALRWFRNPPAGEVLRGRMTIRGKDAVGETKGIVIAQHDLLDEAGRLVFSCLARSVHPR
jgi:hypothetical protein